MNGMPPDVFVAMITVGGIVLAIVCLVVLRFTLTRRLKKHLDAFGIDMIVEKIEGEDMLRELLDFNIDYGQGYLFGKPDHSAAFHKKAA